MRRLFKNKKNILILLVMIILLFLVSYVIYRTQKNYTVTCTLNTIEDNYKERVKVIINEREIYTENNFSSDNYKIIDLKNNELLSLGYKISKSSSRLIASKTVSNSIKASVIAKEYNDSGYACSLEKSKPRKVNFSLKDYKKNLEIHSNYSDSKYNYNLHNEVKVDSSNVDMDVAGNYIVIYKTTVGIQNYYLYEEVNVFDNKPPVITLNGNSHIVVNLNADYNDPGFSVTDNSGKDLNSSVKVINNVDTHKAGIYDVKYVVDDASLNESVKTREVVVKDVKNENGITYVNGYIVANKKYSLPESYNPGLNKDALAAFNNLKSAALNDGHDIELLSGFRSYASQQIIYQNYRNAYGDEADTFSAKPGFSEHQTGYAMDVGKIDNNYGDTADGKWLNDNCYKYGFILRYPKGKQDITGYVYEPWHIRYLNIDLATRITNSGLTFEEYFEI